MLGKIVKTAAARRYERIDPTDRTMPAQFKGLGISFQYPENWKLDDSDARLGRKSVTVYSPGGAFWSVTIHSGSTDPAKLTQAVVAAMREEYDSLEAEEVTENDRRTRDDGLRSQLLLP